MHTSRRLEVTFMEAPGGIVDEKHNKSYKFLSFGRLHEPFSAIAVLSPDGKPSLAASGTQ